MVSHSEKIVEITDEEDENGSNGKKRGEFSCTNRLDVSQDSGS